MAHAAMYGPFLFALLFGQMVQCGEKSARPRIFCKFHAKIEFQP
jgi:hypothetical protein